MVNVKKNKLISFVFIMLLTISLSHGQAISKRILIEYVDFKLETSEDLSCIDFSCLSNEFKKLIIEVNKQKIKNIINATNYFILTNEKHLDVRLKLTIVFKIDKKITFCMNKFGYYYIEGRSSRIYKNDKLFKILTSYIPIQKR